MRDIKKLKQQSWETEQLQENISEFLRNFDFTLLRGRLLEEENSEGVLSQKVSIPNSEKTFSHGLGRNYQGFIIVECDENANFKNVRSSDKIQGRSADEFFITLEASTSCNAKVWVF